LYGTGTAISARTARQIHRNVWSTVDRTPLGPRGRARLVAAVPDGRSLWRAKVRATDDHLAATSPRIRLRTG